MAVQQFTVAWNAAPLTELQKRQARWRSFQVIFSLTYIGIVLDVLTTAMGMARAGTGYEKNPLGLALIGHLGWIGILMLLTAISLFLYWCCREVAWRMSLRWMMVVNLLLMIVTTFRWLAVVTAVLYLVSPT